jgi:lactose/L-arabinose transport system permease protein
MFSARHGKKTTLASRESVVFILFVLPAVVIIALFTVYPILNAFSLSLSEFAGFGQPRFTGLENFRKVLLDGTFWTSAKNTGLFWLGSALPTIVIALFLALMLNSALTRMKGLFRVVHYLPSITSTVAVSMVFQMMMSERFGLFNSVLGLLGVTAIPWLRDPAWAKVSIVMVVIWRSVGWFMVFMLAALQSVDPSLYEAASVDGANAWRQFVSITIPGIFHVLTFCIILTLINIAKAFTEPYILTNGGPGTATLSMVLYLYKQAFGYIDMGYACTIGVMIFGMTIVVALFQLRFLSRMYST